MPSQTPLQAERRLPLPEFVALMTMISAVVAFSIDSMLPALGEIAADLTPQNVNRAQLVITSFLAGLGLGTLFAGPTSDALGRKRTIFIGFAIYSIASIAAMLSQSLDVLLIARFVMGLGAAAPRVATMALVRDLYSGREMARITSFVSMMFVLIPALAPLIGRLIIIYFGWHGLFGAFVVLAVTGGLWISLRQPETLPAHLRRGFNARSLLSGMVEVLDNGQVLLITLVLGLGFGQMFSLLSTAEQIYRVIFDRADSFPVYFAATAILAGTANLLNVKLVGRLGMRVMARNAYLAQIIVSGVVGLLIFSGQIPDALAFPLFFIWSISVFAMSGVTFGNLNVLAMQKMGHLAGTTASVTSAFSTFCAVAVAIPVGLAFQGTLMPLVLATLGCSAAAYILMHWVHDV